MKINENLKLILNLNRVQQTLERRFEGYLDGLGFSDFIILFHLYQDSDGKMRRIDLAEKVGLTASGVTRQLLSMEKIGLVGRRVNKNDARSTYVTLRSGGKRKFEEAMKQAELFCDELTPLKNSRETMSLSKLLLELGGKIR